MNFQRYTDRVIVVTLLPFIPRTITPNQITSLRILSLPVIFYLLQTQNYFWGLLLFTVAALTDALDGAMARSRNQITDLGKALDAIADKGLIALVAFYFIPKYFGWDLLIIMIVLEIFNAIMAYISKLRIKANPEANWAGKIKMIIQSFAFIFIFLGVFTSNNTWFVVSLWFLYASLPFNLIQSFLYPKE